MPPEVEKQIERRFLPMEAAGISIEERDDEPSRLNGIASVFYDGTPRTEYELWPGVVERIMPTAFDKVIKQHDEDTVALFNHNPDNLLGRRSNKTLRLRRTPEGLAYYVPVSDTTVSQDVAKHVKRGDLTGSSFSFLVETDEWHKEDGKEVRELHSVFPLYDVGPVTMPAYKATSVSARSREMWEAGRAEEPPAEEPAVDEGDPEPNEDDVRFADWQQMKARALTGSDHLG